MHVNVWALSLGLRLKDRVVCLISVKALEVLEVHLQRRVLDVSFRL